MYPFRGSHRLHSDLFRLLRAGYSPCSTQNQEHLMVVTVAGMAASSSAVERRNTQFRRHSLDAQPVGTTQDYAAVIRQRAGRLMPPNLPLQKRLFLIVQH